MLSVVIRGCENLFEGLANLNYLSFTAVLLQVVLDSCVF